MSGKIVQPRQAKIVRNATSRSKGRRGNDAYRVREHLTEAEMDKLLGALKRKDFSGKNLFEEILHGDP